jgi:hypothetical protein
MKNTHFDHARPITELKTRTSALTTLCLFCALAINSAAQIQQMVAEPADSSVFNEIHEFDLYNAGLFWWSGGNACSPPEFASFTRIGLLGYATSPPLPAHYVMQDCVARPAFVVRDDVFVYYTDNNTGRLYKKPVAAQPADPPIEIPTPSTPLTSGFQFGAMMFWNGRLYWTDNSANLIRVHSINPDGTSPRDDLVAGVLGVNNVKKIVGFSYHQSSFTYVDAMFILTAGGKLLRQDTNPPAYDLEQLDTGVLDFTLRNEVVHSGTVFSAFTSLYAAKGVNSGACASIVSGSLVRLDAGTAGGGETLLYQANNQYQVTSVAVDDNYLFLTEQGLLAFGANCSVGADPSNIRRQPRPSTNPGNNQWDQPIVSSAFGQPAGPNLRSDGQWLYFMRQNVIGRIPTGTPPIGFDFQADALEVVQASQDLNQSVALVANKPTFARGYAHVAQNTTTKTNFFPAAVLHGFLNNVEFLDSPIGLYATPSIDTNQSPDILRPSLAKSFLFQLPQSWVQAGSLRLTMTINPDLSIPETGANPLGNNSATTTLSVTKKGRACLVLAPMRTDYASFDPGVSDVSDILDRARTLLPVEDFNVFYQTEQVEKPVVRSCFCLPPVYIDMDPFHFPEDQYWALICMAARHALSSDPPGQKDVHYVGAVTRSVSGWDGIAGAPGAKLSDLSGWLPDTTIPPTVFDSTSVVRFEPAPGFVPFDSPKGGVTLAHELGHNYGRFHIDQTASQPGCGGHQPARPYQLDYPYDHCTIGTNTGPAAIFGFDPITKAVIPPQTGDLMTYAGLTWSSGFTWDAIFGQVPGAAAAPPAATPSRQPPQVLLVRGLIDLSSNSVAFHTFYLLNNTDVDPAKLASDLSAASGMAAGNPYQLILRNSAGIGLRTNNLLLFPGARDFGEQIGFVQFSPFDPLTYRVQVAYNGAVIGERVVSPHAPAIAISSLSLDAANQLITLAWNATDADGDPLVFTVQYSADNGTTWNTLKLDCVWQSVTLSSKLLRGSTTARLRVLASDGLNTSIATSSAFTIPKHAPQVMVQGLLPGQRVAYGSFARLTGLALDAEDGSLTGLNLQWQLLGPTPQSGSGVALPLTGISPGAYTAILSANDSDDMDGVGTLNFQVLPLVVPESIAPAFDGTGSDPAYGNAAQVRLALGNNRFVYGRLIHAANALYASFSGMKFSANPSLPSRIGLRVDPDFSQTSGPQPNDSGFYIQEDGLSFQLTGNGSTMSPPLSPSLGFSALIARGSNGWCAELKIADALLGGWNHAAGLMISHESVISSADAYPWPVSATSNSPASWAPAYFGTLPPQPNRAPVAIAGPNQFLDLSEGRTVYLDGSASYDPDGDPLSYQWVQTSGPSLTLSNASGAACAFGAAPVAVQTTLGFQLTVSDGFLFSTTNTFVTLLPTQRPRMTFATWKPAFFSAAQLTNPAVSGGSADPDQDGVVNLLEYAFDMNPLLADADAAVQQGMGRPIFGSAIDFDPATSSNQTFPTITFVRWKDPVDLIYSVQNSRDLAQWIDQTTSPGSFKTLSRTDVGDGSHLELVTVRPATPMTGPNAPSHQFLRVAVTWSP